jgi:hypothetical protein
MRVIKHIRKLLCQHSWRISRFQALIGGTSYQCTKCGKYRNDN